MTAREVITSETCTSCGACCIALSDYGVYCNVTIDDVKRLSKSFVRRNITLAAIRTIWKEQKAGPMKGTEICVCAALRGSIMSRVRVLYMIIALRFAARRLCQETRIVENCAWKYAGTRVMNENYDRAIKHVVSALRGAENGMAEANLHTIEHVTPEAKVGS